MTPSCSAYAAESIKKYGFLEGYLMTCDRLIRCGRDELNISPIVKSGDDRLCLDPPNENRIK
jgi:putative component of membrane protein insertase Oxa1/YidC/SpoIIIJ protein YidD